MDPLPTFTPLDWRLLSGACEEVAAKERAQAEAIGGRAGADYENSAQEYASLAARCMRMARGA